MANPMDLTMNFFANDRGLGKALGSIGSTLGSVAKTAAGFALGAGLAELPGALMDMAKGAAEDEKATARLGQTIRNVGGDFDTISRQVDGAIAAGQRLAFSDDEVRDSFQALAVATGSSDEALRRQKIGMDLARGANIPLGAATKLLGKVTAENVEVFKRMGITIGEGASEAEALAVIQAKFGGQAEAYAQSTAGQFEAAQIAFGEMGESIGGIFLPILTTLMSKVSEFMPIISEWVAGFAGGISETIGPALEGVTTSLQPLLEVLPDIGTAIGQAFAFFTGGGGDIETFRGVLNKLVGAEGAQMVIEIFTNVSGLFRETIIPMFQSFGEVVGKVLKGDFGGALEGAGKHIATFGPKLIETLAGWGERFVGWVAPMIPPLLTKLGELATQMLAWVVNKLPDIVAKLQEWGQKFVDFVAPFIPPLLAEAGKLAQQLLAWVAEQAPPLAQTLLTEWLPAVINWLLQAGIDIGPKLGAFLTGILDWAILNGPGLATTLITQWVPAAIGWVAEAAIKIAPKLLEFLTMLGKWIQEEAQPRLNTLMLGMGKAIVESLASAMTTAGSAVWTSLMGDQPESLKSLVGRGLRAVVDWGAEQLNQVYERLVGPFQGAWDKIKGLLDAIMGAFEKAKEILRNFPGVPSGGGGGDGGGGGTPGGSAAQSIGSPGLVGAKSVIVAGASGGDVYNINVTVPDSFGMADRELPGRVADAIHSALLQKQRRNGTLGLVAGGA